MSLTLQFMDDYDVFKNGYRYMHSSNQSAMKNIQDASELPQVVRTGYGPNGRSKLVVNYQSQPTVTSDAATVMRCAEIEHPLAKLLAIAGQSQENEVGDGTNFVVLLAGALLMMAKSSLAEGLHPSEITHGYELACQKAIATLSTLATAPYTTVLANPHLVRVLLPIICAKQCGFEEILARVVADAVVIAATDDTIDIENIRVVKVVGGDLSSSRVVRGMVLPRVPDGGAKDFHHVAVAVYTCPLDFPQGDTKGTAIWTAATDIRNFNRDDNTQMASVIQDIYSAGVRVVIAGSTVSEYASHFFDRWNIGVLRVPSKFDLRRLSRVVRASPLSRFGPPSRNEVGFLGSLECVEIAGISMATFSERCSEAGCQLCGIDQGASIASILLRGPTSSILDEAERTIDDCVLVLKTLARDSRFVPGAGGCELELARQLKQYGDDFTTLTRHAVVQFSSALEVVPRILAENNYGASYAESIIGRIMNEHYNGNTTLGIRIQRHDVVLGSEEKSGGSDAGVLDSLAVKLCAIRNATDAALAVLAVDTVISSKAAGTNGPSVPSRDE